MAGQAVENVMHPLRRARPPWRRHLRQRPTPKRCRGRQSHRRVQQTIRAMLVGQTGQWRGCLWCGSKGQLQLAGDLQGGPRRFA